MEKDMIPFVLRAREFAEYHQRPATNYLHIASIFFLILATMIFLGFIHLSMPGVFTLTLTDLFVLGLLIYYFRLNWILALAITPIFIILLWVSMLISHNGPHYYSMWTLMICLSLGTILHVIGYLIEGSYPNFKTSVSHALLSPLYFVAELFFAFGKMSVLREKIHAYSGSEVIGD
jgi:uncharacterized membrane protein YGL010W